MANKVLTIIRSDLPGHQHSLEFDGLRYDNLSEQDVLKACEHVIWRGDLRDIDHQHISDAPCPICRGVGKPCISK
jgi:hypothetical protein